MKTAYLYLLQRVTALILAPLVLTHLGLILYAVRGGISASEILARTQGSVGWAMFYSLFVVAAAAHVTVGLGTIIKEWTPIKQSYAFGLAMAFGLFALVLGLRAVYAVIAS